MDSGYYLVPGAQWGFASSPVIHDGKVVVLCDVQKDSFLAVFDLETGKELWRTARQDVPTWGTPTVYASGVVFRPFSYSSSSDSVVGGAGRLFFCRHASSQFLQPRYCPSRPPVTRPRRPSPGCPSC